MQCSMMLCLICIEVKVNLFLIFSSGVFDFLLKSIKIMEKFLTFKDEVDSHSI